MKKINQKIEQSKTGLPEAVASLQAGWQRTQADFENYKKRVEQDRANWSREAKIEVLDKILPILDNLHLASAHTPNELKENQWVQGINHIAKQIENNFDELGIEKIVPDPGNKFDHTIHEAVSTEQSKKYPEDSILETKYAGYKVEGILIRPAKVIVSKKS